MVQTGESQVKRTMLSISSRQLEKGRIKSVCWERKGRRKVILIFKNNFSAENVVPENDLKLVELLYQCAAT